MKNLVAGCAARHAPAPLAPDVLALAAELDSAFGGAPFARASWGVMVQSLDRSQGRIGGGIADATAAPATFTGNRALQIEEPLIFEMGQSGRCGAWTLDDQPGLIQHPISASSRVRPSAAATDLMSGATALGGIFSARAISFGVRPASRSSRTRASNCCVGIRNIVPEPAALLGRHAGGSVSSRGVAPGRSDECRSLPR